MLCFLQYLLIKNEKTPKVDTYNLQLNENFKEKIGKKLKQKKNRKENENENENPPVHHWTNELIEKCSRLKTVLMQLRLNVKIYIYN